MTSYLYTIGPEHVSHKTWPYKGQHKGEYVWTWHALIECMGLIQPNDYGKRAYAVDGIVQVENDEQRNRRLNRAAQT